MNDTSVPCRPKPPSRDLADATDLVPDNSRCRQDDSLRQTVALLNLHLGSGEIEDLNHDFILRAGIVRVYDADAIGDEQPALEWRTASSENSKKMTGRYLDNETGPHQRHATRRDRQIVSGSEVEPCCFMGGI